MEVGETVCVTGASGFVGSWLVMRLLERGYIVRATVVDPSDMKDVEHLLNLPNAATHLSLWRADLKEEGSFDEAIQGCTGVFHLATIMNFESKDPENEVIKPVVNGMLDIMKSCVRTKVRRLVYTSSAAAVDLEEYKKPVYNENCWSDVQFCRRVKMTGWMYFVSKTMAEQAAWRFVEENNLDFISILPTTVMGPFLINTMPPSFKTSLSPITRNESHYHILRDGQFIHLDDLCMSHIYLYELPEASGRYICSSHDASIFELTRMLNKTYPEYNVQTEFDFEDSKEPPISFSSRKLLESGFKFKYSLEDMYAGAVETCRKKGLIPMSFQNQSSHS